MDPTPSVPTPQKKDRLSSLRDFLIRLSQKYRFREHRFLLWCMLLPAAIVFLIYLVRGLHPLGDGSVLVLDLNGQYVYFFEALRSFVRGDADLLYSFSRALGGEFLGIYAYYLASPLSFLVCLFPTDRMLEGLLCLFLIKTALCGASFGYYMHKTMTVKNKLAIILFASCYALSSYCLVQQNNTMWIDAVMWLPLITLGIERVIKHGRFKLYVISLAVAVFSNYYIGYMLCIWCLLYFFVYYLAHTREVRNPMGERLHFLRSLGRMALWSALAIGIAAVVILGAYYSLNFGKTTFSDPSWELTSKLDLLDVFYKLLPGSYDTVRPEGLPFLYCGMLTLLLLPSYFLCKHYPIRQKAFSAILLFILFLTASVSITDLIWHGFQSPNWLNYRYSFMFCFYLCVLACRAFADTEHLSFKATLCTGGGIALLCVVAQQSIPGEYPLYNNFTCIYFSLILIFAYLALFGYWKKTDRKKRARNGLVILLAAELFLNGLFNIVFLDMDVGYASYSSYNDFLDDLRPAVQSVQESDTSFYRMEKTIFRKTNDNMALGIRGLSGSTSTLNKETIKLLNKMGYASKSHWSKYLGGTPVSDSLLGIKYIISENQVYGGYYDTFATAPTSGYVTYQNPYALSIAYRADEDVLTFPLGFYDSGAADEKEDLDVSEDGTVKLGLISRVISAVKGKINAMLGIEENTGDTYRDDYNSPFERLNAMVTAMLGEEETARIFLPISGYTVDTENVYRGSYENGTGISYKHTSANTTGSITYTVTVLKDGEVYFNIPTDYPREVELTLSVNGEVEKDWGTFNGNETQRIISLGSHTAGDRLSLKMTLLDDAFYLTSGEECFYYIDWEAFEDAFAKLAENQLTVTEYTEHSFVGTYQGATSNDLVMTTIAYDNGWEIYVDGERVEPEKAFGSLLSFHVEGDSGETHDIEMFYRPRAVRLGVIISLISLILFIGLAVLDHFVPFSCRARKHKKAIAEGAALPDAEEAIGEERSATPELTAAPPEEITPNPETFENERKEE